MRTIATVTLVLYALVAPATAQSLPSSVPVSASASPPLPPPVSLDSLRAALDRARQPSLRLPASPLWPLPARTRLGFLTLAPPDTNGEIVNVVVPVGDLVSRAARGISGASRRRAERRAQERVDRDIGRFRIEPAPK